MEKLRKENLDIKKEPCKTLILLKNMVVASEFESPTPTMSRCRAIIGQTYDL